MLVLLVVGGKKKVNVLENEEGNCTKTQRTYCCSFFKCQVFVVHFTRQKGVGCEDLSGFGIQERGSDAVCRVFAMILVRVTKNKVDLFMWPCL